MAKAWMRKMRAREYAGVIEQLALEQFQLSEWMEHELGMDYNEAAEIVQRLSGEVLPGYRGIEKLSVFRHEIRDRIHSSVEVCQ